ncbi:MAG TPA: peptide ABC transporter substrate-binding protein, partial [Bryobacteraceae bacterium]|nr:peptide ABC transporter substrate-binding protein [Bryobacteraceae bacterium]
CARAEGPYFGSTAGPKQAALVHLLNGEIDTIDPAKSIGSYEFYVMPALFEGLTQYHPELPRPMAGLATHYETNADFTKFRFYLRGHPAPRGVRLPSCADLSDKFLQGRTPSPDSARAYWSDGVPITAHDFVYSWRRFADPGTAAPQSDQYFLVKNARDVFTGKRPPSDLGVHAPDEFTFVVDLQSSATFFLEVITSYLFSAVPKHLVEAARNRNAEATWTEPSQIVTSGPFVLRDYRRYERLVLVPNTRYYDAHLVGLKELVFLPVIDGTTVMNLYKAGDIMLTPGLSLSPLFTPVLSRKKDYHAGPGFGTLFVHISTRRTPFDNVLLRYALNMATEKKVLTDFLGPGFVPATSFVAPIPEYPQPESLSVEVDGRIYDVLAFDVEGARSLLAKAGFTGGIRDGRRLEVPFHFPMLPEARPRAEILQQQWLQHLNISAKLIPREFNVHWRMVLERDYTGVADFAVLPLYLDPNGFLEKFSGGPDNNPSGWTDPGYISNLEAANTTLSRTGRMERLAACERTLLKAMPFLPFYHAAWSYLCKPFVRGLASHLFDIRAFKYVWIDKNWRPQ